MGLTQLTEIAQQAGVPPGGRIVAFLHNQTSNAYPDYRGDLFINELLVNTFAAAAARCSKVGDTVVVLPGHAENVASTTFGSPIVAGARFVGFGRGTAQPTFTWTGTTYQLAVDVANVEFHGLKFAINGANDITKGISITGTDCLFQDCLFDVSTDTNLHAAIAIEVGTGAHRSKFNRCKIIGYSDAITDAIKVAGVANDVEIVDCDIDVPGPAATTGVVNIGAVAALRFRMVNCTLRNTTTSSDFVFATGNAANSGCVRDCVISVLNATALTDGISLGAASLFQNGRNYVSNLVLESGGIQGTVST